MAVSAGLCGSGGLTVTVWTRFGAWAWALAAVIDAARIDTARLGSVAARIDLMARISSLNDSHAGIVRTNGLSTSNLSATERAGFTGQGHAEAEELERYARHIVIREIGGPGQAALKTARVLVIGAGGLGSPALLYLAAAGVGTLGVIDDDTVSLSNLQRQIIHATDAVGRPKVASTAETIARINPEVKVRTHEVRLDATNALALLGEYDVIADGSDNFTTRYLVSDACYLANKPLVTGALGVFDGIADDDPRA